MAVGVNKRRQQRTALGVQHVLALGQGQPQADGGDLTVLHPDFQRLTVTVFCVADQHSLLLFAGFTKKDFSQKTGKVKKKYLVQRTEKRTPHG